MSAAPVDSGELVGCLRDLTSLLALPALWSGRRPDVMVRTLFEALESVLPLAVCYLEESNRHGEDGGYLWTRSSLASAAEKHAWREFIAACRTQRANVATTPSPAGALRVAAIRTIRTSMGGMSLWVASPDPAFPTATQRIYLVAASNLAATGLASADLLSEREQADRAKDEFLAMLAHELRNPLAPIAVALELMKRKDASLVSHERALIERQVRHLTRLVDDLLDVARVSQGKIELRAEPVDMARVIVEAVELAQPVVENKKQRLSVEMASDADLLVSGDGARLKQAVGNVLLNAAKYTDEGGSISVSGRREGSLVRIVVSDTGIGIAPQMMPRIFDLFAQGDGELARSRGGLGIGLALVKRIVTLHGGTVAAYSAGTGNGSRFTIDVPALPRGTTLSTLSTLSTHGAMRGAEAPCRGHRCLVVDDNRDVADAMAAYLQALGCEAEACYDAGAALARLCACRPTVVFLDIGLPDMNGYQLAGRIRALALRPSPHLVAVTGYGQESDRAASLAAGIAHHFTKPVDPEQVRALLAHYPAEAGAVAGTELSS